MHEAVKVVIITERVLLDRIAAVIEEVGATGFTYTDAGGKGSRGIRRAGRARVSDLSSNVKIETVVSAMPVAESLVDAVNARFFEDYSGICYVIPVGILRPEKFRA